MKRVLVCCLLFCAFVVVAIAQSTQQVQIREYQQKQQKTPLEGVSLTVQNAGSVMSDAQGNLTLQFRSLKAGDQVQVRRVDLSGYEIFNKDAVDQWTISPQKAFTLVLCKSERFKALRDQYMRVSSASYERQFKLDQARIEALKRENKFKEEEYLEQLQLLEDNYYQQLDNLENYVDRFARIDLSEISEQEQHIVELVQEGNIAEAVRLYESGDYLNKYKAQVKGIKEIDRAQARLAQIEAEKLEARENLFAAIKRQTQVYQLAGGKENWEKIMSLLKSVAEADTTNLDAVWYYATIALDQNEFQESERYLHVFLNQVAGNLALTSSSLYYLSRIYALLRMNDEAEQCLLESIKMRELLLNNESSFINRFYFLIQKTFLHTFYANNAMYDRVKTFSVDLQSQLSALLAEAESAEDKAELWQNLATVKSEYGLAIAVEDEDYAQAERYVSEAYRLCKENMDSENPDHLICLTQVLFNLVGIYEQQERWQDQVAALSEHVAIVKSLYEKNPTSFDLAFFESLNSMADALVQQGDLGSAEELVNNALQMLPSLKERYRQSLFVDEMGFYDTIAQLYLAKGDTEKSQQYAKLCLDAFGLMPVELQEAYQEVSKRWR